MSDEQDETETIDEEVVVANEPAILVDTDLLEEMDENGDVIESD